ncbi:MAG: hypothetical protein AB1449_15150, partial [Chloroflexota bacterium]
GPMRRAERAPSAAVQPTYRWAYKDAFVARTTDETPPHEESRTISYTYDPLYRLTAADYSDGTYFHYTYDAVGNRLVETTVAGTTPYTYDDANRLTSVGGVAYAWSDNGNLLFDGTNAYLYPSPSLGTRGNGRISEEQPGGCSSLRSECCASNTTWATPWARCATS